MVKKPGLDGGTPITIDTTTLTDGPGGEAAKKTTVRINPELPPPNLTGNRPASSVQARQGGQSSIVSVRQTQPTRRGNPKRTSKLKIALLGTSVAGLSAPDMMAMSALLGAGTDILERKLAALVPEGVEVDVGIVLGQLDPRNIEATLSTAISDAIRNFQEVQ